MLANMFLFWVIDNLTLSQPSNIAWTDPPPLIILRLPPSLSQPSNIAWTEPVLRQCSDFLLPSANPLTSCASAGCHTKYGNHAEVAHASTAGTGKACIIHL